MRRNSLKHILGWVCVVVAAGLSVLMAAGSLSAQTVSFIAREDLSPGGLHPRAVVVGDFNGDGKLDLAVVNRGLTPFSVGTVVVFLGNGDGTFHGSVSFSAGIDSASIVVGDFNGDGKLDLAVANSGSNNVSVALGNGDGTFQVARNFNVGNSPASLAVGDFDGDGNLDLAVANSGSNNVSVLLGDGHGNFQPAVNFATGTGPVSVAVGDFNGDGQLDLVVANSGSNSVSVLLGNGDGTFQEVRNFPAGRNPTSVAVADFNRDAKLDLAVADRGAGGAGISVLLGNGDGTFQPAMMPVFPANSPTSVAVGDFNGDGKPDLAVADVRSGLFHGIVWVLLGNGDGTFQVAAALAGGQFPQSIIVGDFNGDGNLDLAVAKLASNDVSVLPGNGDGTVEGSAGFIAVPQPILVDNMNDADKLDLALVKLFSEDLSALGDDGGDPDFGADLRPRSVAAGDFNRDGKLDLVVANSTSNNVSVLINSTPGDAPKKRRH